MAVRRIRAEEWRALRALRLRALADAPDAFLMTLADVELDPDEVWQEWAERAATSERTAVFVDDDFTGMAGGHVGEGDDSDAVLFGMWVAPERRGSGLAEALVETVVGWARTRGVERVVLNVVDSNTPAIRLYERCGFRDTGVRGRMRDATNRQYALALTRPG